MDSHHPSDTAGVARLRKQTDNINPHRSHLHTVSLAAALLDIDSHSQGQQLQRTGVAPSHRSPALWKTAVETPCRTNNPSKAACTETTSSRRQELYRDIACTGAHAWPLRHECPAAETSRDACSQITTPLGDAGSLTANTQSLTNSYSRKESFTACLLDTLPLTVASTHYPRPCFICTQLSESCTALPLPLLSFLFSLNLELTL